MAEKELPYMHKVIKKIDASGAAIDSREVFVRGETLKEVKKTFNKLWKND